MFYGDPTDSMTMLIRNHDIVNLVIVNYNREVDLNTNGRYPTFVFAFSNKELGNKYDIAWFIASHCS